MKKKVLFSLALIIFICLLSMLISAKEYSPQTGAELSAVINEITASSEDAIINLSGSYTDYKENAGYKIQTENKITFNLTDNTELASRLYIIGSSNVVVNLNGYLLSNNTSRGGVEGSMFCIDDSASLEVYNGELFINDVCIAFEDGSLKLQNVSIEANEETIWCKQQMCNGNGRNYYLDNCTLSGNDGANIYCITPNSYITNCNFTRGNVKFDAWHKHGEKDSAAVLENITVSNGAMGNYTSSNVYIFKNCKFGDVTTSGDGGGAGAMHFYDTTYTNLSYNKAGRLYDHKSPTCTEAGALITYSAESTSGVVDSEYPQLNPALGHSFDENSIIDVSYTSYLEYGSYVSSCARCEDGVAYEEIPSAQPLFECYGYSTPEKNKDGIVIGFAVHKDAIELYEQITGKSLEFGAFAIAEKNIVDNKVLNDDGTAVQGAIKAKVSDLGFVSFELKISGFTTEAQMKASLAIGAYVIATRDNEITISYLQHGTPLEENVFTFISLNEINGK